MVCNTVALVVVVAIAGRPRPPEPATDDVAPPNMLTNGEGATPVNDAELVFCETLTTVPGDISLYSGAEVVTGIDNCSATGAASHFSTTTINTSPKSNAKQIIRLLGTKVKPSFCLQPQCTVT